MEKPIGKQDNSNEDSEPDAYPIIPKGPIGRFRWRLEAIAGLTLLAGEAVAAVAFPVYKTYCYFTTPPPSSQQKIMDQVTNIPSFPQSIPQGNYAPRS